MHSVIDNLLFLDADGHEIQVDLDISALEFTEPYSGFTPLRDDCAESIIIPFLIPNGYVLSTNSSSHYRAMQSRGGNLSRLYNNIVEQLPEMSGDKSYWVIDALVCPANNALRDTHNYYPSIKPFVDSLTRSKKFFPDDNFNYVSCYMGYGTKLGSDEKSKIRFTTNAEHYFKQTKRSKVPLALGFIVRIARYDHS